MVVSFMVLFILVLYIYCSVHSSNRTYFRYSTTSRRFRLSSSERIDIVKWYAVYQNAAEVARQFQHHCERAPPTRESILDITRKFDETGSVQIYLDPVDLDLLAPMTIKNVLSPLFKNVLRHHREELLWS